MLEKEEQKGAEVALLQNVGYGNEKSLFSMGDKRRIIRDGTHSRG